MSAAYNGCFDVVAALLDVDGIDVDAQDATGDDAIAISERKNHSRILS